MRDDGLKVGDEVIVVKTTAEMGNDDWKGIIKVSSSCKIGDTIKIRSFNSNHYHLFQYVGNSYWFPITMIMPANNKVIPNGLFKKLKTNNGKI